MEKNEKEKLPINHKEETHKEGKLNSIYFCKNCKKVPFMNLRRCLKIDIKCKCNNVLEKKEISDYFKDIYSEKPPIYCNDIEEHKEIKTVKYCSECQKWVCEDCIKNHNPNSSAHNIIQSDGFIINSSCEHPKCSIRGKSEFYCKHCNLHVCRDCKNEHFHEGNQLVKLKHDIDVDEIVKNVESKLESLKLEESKYNKIFDEMENLIKIAKIKMKEKSNKINEIMKYFSSLLFAYSLNKENYVLSQNLKNNDISNVLKYTEKEYKKEIIYAFRQSLSMELINKISEHSYVKMKYDISKKDKENHETWIFGDNFNGINPSNSIMFIDGKLCPFTKKFKDDLKGLHKVKVLIEPDKEVTDLSFMFACCFSLVSVDFTHFDTSSVKNMSFMFATGIEEERLLIPYRYSQLKTLNLNAMETSNVEDMSYMFSSNYHLKDLKILNFDTSNVKNMEHMFSDCTSLSHIELTSFSTNKVVSMRFMFSNCQSLKNLDISFFDISNLIDATSMFCDCSSLTNLNFNQEQFLEIENKKLIFSSCKKLSSDVREKFEHKKKKSNF